MFTCPVLSLSKDSFCRRLLFFKATRPCLVLGQREREKERERVKNLWGNCRNKKKSAFSYSASTLGF